MKLDTDDVISIHVEGLINALFCYYTHVGKVCESFSQILLDLLCSVLIWFTDILSAMNYFMLINLVTRP